MGKWQSSQERRAESARASPVSSHVKGVCVAIEGRKRDVAERIAVEIEETGGHAIFVPLEVSDQSQWEAAAKVTVDAFVRLDILANNAGTNEGGWPGCRCCSIASESVGLMAAGHLADSALEELPSLEDIRRIAAR